ncbi:MAG: hypothetical protein ABIJ47_06905, partial [Candidatus Bathyarchaeota archaeon]
MNETRQAHVKRILTVAFILGLVFASLGFSGVITIPLAEGAAARVFFSAVSPDASGYPVDGAVGINVKFKWEGLSANTTVNIQLWNATNMMEDLGNYTANGDASASGTETVQYTPTVELTEETGTTSYTLKMLSG